MERGTVEMKKMQRFLENGFFFLSFFLSVSLSVAPPPPPVFLLVRGMTTVAS
jgi:hypothetical protein